MAEQQFSQQAIRAELHGVDQSAAKRAVDFFVKHRMPAPLIERLKARGNEVRIEAVRGLRAIGDQSALPAIADLLESEQEPVGESEDATIHKILKKEALQAASQLSGESFEVNDLNDERALQAVVQRLRTKSR